MSKRIWPVIAMGVALVALGGAARASTLHSTGAARFHYGSPERLGLPGATRPAGPGGAQIYSMNADGSDQTRLTNGQENEYPAWSPDGAQIAYTQFASDAEIFVMDADGSNGRDLSNDPATEDYDPSWSPDGTKIAFARATDSSNFDIWVMDADGTHQTQLTTEPAFDGYPAWSPDGTHIAFTRPLDDGQNDIFVMNADGSNQLVAGRHRDRLQPAHHSGLLRRVHHERGRIGSRRRDQQRRRGRVRGRLVP